MVLKTGGKRFWWRLSSRPRYSKLHSLSPRVFLNNCKFGTNRIRQIEAMHNDNCVFEVILTRFTRRESLSWDWQSRLETCVTYPPVEAPRQQGLTWEHEWVAPPVSWRASSLRLVDNWAITRISLIEHVCCKVRSQNAFKMIPTFIPLLPYAIPFPTEFIQLWSSTQIVPELGVFRLNPPIIVLFKARQLSLPSTP